jgi:repressor LexA
MLKKIQSFKERLSEAMRLRDLKQSQLVEKTGISKSLINIYVKGVSEPKQLNIIKIANALNVSPTWLMGYDVPIINKHDVTKPIAIPIVGNISAGLPILADQNIEGYTFAPSMYCREDYKYFYLKVRGDSMNLIFDDGDYILVQQQDYLEDGEIGVILIGEEATTKKYRKVDDLVILEPMSNNSEHVTQVYDSKQFNINIIGKVVAYIGKV